MEFSLTSSSSRTPLAASHSASASSSGGRRETNAPRKDGMAQNEQRRSQPEAIFSGAVTPPASRLRITCGPEAGATPGGSGGTQRAVSSASRSAWRLAGLTGSSVRRSLATCAGRCLPASTSSRRAAMSA